MTGFSAISRASSTWRLLLSLLAVAALLNMSSAFSSSRQKMAFRQTVRTTADSSRPYAYASPASMGSTVIEPGTKEDVQRRSKDDFLGDKEENFEEELRKNGPLEYLEDENESREMDDPFHILLLGSTFEKPKITVPYVASALEYVLDMPIDEATEQSQFSYEQGMSCLGTWSREECLNLGRQLQVRDIVCRVVPFAEGGQRGWQARDADSSFSNLRSAE